MICTACKTERDLGDRLPKGWKRIHHDILCGACVAKRYVLRAVTIPAVGPVCTETPGHKKSEPLDWTGLRERLRASWIATTQASNWMAREMALADPGFGENGKLQKMPKLYFYPEIRKRWPILATYSANTLEQASQKKYRETRFDLALCKRSLPTFRYPQPIPVHGATWKVWEDEGGRLLVSFLLADGRVTLRLRGGADFRRQRKNARQIITGVAKQGELSIYRVGATPGDHRTGFTKNTRVMIKMVGYFPVAENRSQSAASMMTGGDAFLTLYDAGENRIFRWNADHIRRKIAAADDVMQRLREDLKAEKRLGRERDGILARMEVVSRHQRHRMHTFCHEVSRQVVNMLNRHKVGLLTYVDVDQSYMPHFPWVALNGMLAEKCSKAGIEFTSGTASGDEVAETA